MKISVLKKPCTGMFTAALVTVTKKYKQANRLPTDELINKMRYVYRLENYTCVKRVKYHYSKYAHEP